MRFLHPLFIGLAFAGLLAARAAQLGSAFSYQGRLLDSGAPANGQYDVRFTLFGAASDGTAIGTVVAQNGVAVIGGLFNCFLDFGTNVFDGTAYWLEVGVRPSGTEAFTTLSPRQAITPTPYAIRAMSASTADVALSANQLGGAAASQFVRTDDPRLTDSGSIKAGSSFYIQNSHDTSLTQEKASFSIDGNGTVGGLLWASKGVLGLSSGTAAVTGIGGDSGVSGLGATYGVSGQQNGGFTSPGAGVYGTSDSSGAYGVFGFSTSGTTNAGVFGKSIAPGGNGVLGLAGSGPNAYAVWGKADQGRGVVGESASGTGVSGKSGGTSGVGVVGEANGSGAYGVWGKSTSGSAVHGSSDAGRAVDGFSASGGTAIYGSNLGSNSKGYAGDFFGRVHVGGDLTVDRGDFVLDQGAAIRVPGAGVGSGTAVFVHKATAANTGGYQNTMTWFDNPLTNGDPNAIIFATPLWTGTDGKMTPYYDSTVGRWGLLLLDKAWPNGVAINVLVIKR